MSLQNVNAKISLMLMDGKIRFPDGTRPVKFKVEEYTEDMTNGLEEAVIMAKHRDQKQEHQFHINFINNTVSDFHG